METYTGQLRNLEAYINTNPRSAQARFVLAYQEPQLLIQERIAQGQSV